jgi:hypothetical protein
VRLRRLRAVLAPLWPTAVLLAAWSAIALAYGADPARPLRWFVPTHTFGTVYEAGLWMRLPDGPERRLLADEKARGHNAYQAAEALEALAGPGTRAAVAQEAIRADPLGYAAARAALLPLEFRQGRWADAELFQYAHPDVTLLRALSRLHSESEGVRFDRRGRVDLKRTRWGGAAAAVGHPAAPRDLTRAHRPVLASRGAHTTHTARRQVWISCTSKPTVRSMAWMQLDVSPQNQFA